MCAPKCEGHSETAQFFPIKMMAGRGVFILAKHLYNLFIVYYSVVFDGLRPLPAFAKKKKKLTCMNYAMLFSMVVTVSDEFAFLECDF